MLDDLVLHKAIEFAALKHKDQKRKCADTPYIVHPVEVMGYLIECGCSTECVAAGILHDTLEDTDTTKEELAEHFGERVAELVGSESEDKSKSWYERKKNTVDGLATACHDTKMICLADKLSNLTSMVGDRETVGEKLWSRFSAPPNDIAWYYRGIINATKGIASPLRKRVIDRYTELFGEDKEIIE